MSVTAWATNIDTANSGPLETAGEWQTAVAAMVDENMVQMVLSVLPNKPVHQVRTALMAHNSVDRAIEHLLWESDNIDRVPTPEVQQTPAPEVQQKESTKDAQPQIRILQRGENLVQAKVPPPQRSENLVQANVPPPPQHGENLVQAKVPPPPPPRRNPGTSKVQSKRNPPPPFFEVKGPMNPPPPPPQQKQKPSCPPPPPMPPKRSQKTIHAQKADQAQKADHAPPKAPPAALAPDTQPVKRTPLSVTAASFTPMGANAPCFQPRDIMDIAKETPIAKKKPEQKVQQSVEVQLKLEAMFNQEDSNRKAKEDQEAQSFAAEVARLANNRQEYVQECETAGVTPYPSSISAPPLFPEVPHDPPPFVPASGFPSGMLCAPQSNASVPPAEKQSSFEAAFLSNPAEVASSQAVHVAKQRQPLYKREQKGKPTPRAQLKMACQGTANLPGDGLTRGDDEKPTTKEDGGEATLLGLADVVGFLNQKRDCGEATLVTGAHVPVPSGDSIPMPKMVASLSMANDGIGAEATMQQEPAINFGVPGFLLEGVVEEEKADSQSGDSTIDSETRLRDADSPEVGEVLPSPSLSDAVLSDADSAEEISAVAGNGEVFQASVSETDSADEVKVPAPVFSFPPGLEVPSGLELALEKQVLPAFFDLPPNPLANMECLEEKKKERTAPWRKESSRTALRHKTEASQCAPLLPPGLEPEPKARPLPPWRKPKAEATASS